jgi:hypothetical protein
MAGRQSEAMRAAKALKTASSEKGVRERLGEALADQYELLLKVLEEGAQATKRVRVEDQPCSRCGCRHTRYAVIKDTATALKVAEFWATQGLGRPGEEKAQGGGPALVVNRYIITPEEAENLGIAGPPRTETEDRGLGDLAKRAAASAPESVERTDRDGAES